ncbi:aldehyde dehydrogenase family protein [Kurthia gibsonii]|uniref:aldehyde dehydrogenase family protein n=1 Tax=Kurthia TaxID=1649 RepID=UPI000745E5DD|nr:MULTISPECIES: aldehyde dehydrogenase family protein [Kurthia]MCA9725225.1 aldehyde dehydrogenase family protein [Kurthia sp.]AMA63299.1 aldehyde dehydrogenase family protein [Kurthia sp. 11kri321]MEB6114122.1 aldehyde dehydrogenase family protein [Kurthia gibsonii]RXH51185.1 aldehyde dehydrogenase family protein [Kurthia gibsonii]HZG10447.1 aldehyde dehydrogenase family protein [Kurthia gibsonii]
MEATQAVKTLKNYINGEWQKPSSNHVEDVINPATGEVIGKIPFSTKEDTERAIQAARQAFESGIWSEKTTHERAAVLLKIADLIEAEADELAKAETIDNGKILAESEFDVADAAACFRYYAGIMLHPDGETYHVPDNVQAMVVKEPVGVTGLIVPWNFPILMSVWKIAPALAAGNAIVYKPSEVTPMNAQRLVEIIEEAGVPKGVMNMVIGDGQTVGQTISESHDVDMVSFTGSTAVGREIMKAASGNLKKISLELGGKSPNIIFADADLETAVDYGLFGIFFGSGQVCSSGSRILVEESIYDAYVERFAERAKLIKVGPGLNPESNMGAIVSQKQLDRILSYIEIGKEEGARLVSGGHRVTADGLDKGFFIEPTVFADCTPDMRIVREEIFGPVVTIQKFKTEEEAIQLANDTDYGLAGGVFSGDGAKALRVIKKVRAGITWVNDYHPTYVEAPWGGYKQSGIGRSLGKYSLEEFQEVKQINIRLNVEPNGWFPTN